MYHCCSKQSACTTKAEGTDWTVCIEHVQATKAADGTRQEIARSTGKTNQVPLLFVSSKQPLAYTSIQDMYIIEPMDVVHDGECVIWKPENGRFFAKLGCFAN